MNFAASHLLTDSRTYSAAVSSELKAKLASLLMELMVKTVG